MLDDKKITARSPGLKLLGHERFFPCMKHILCLWYRQQNTHIFALRTSTLALITSCTMYKSKHLNKIMYAYVFYAGNSCQVEVMDCLSWRLMFFFLFCTQINQIFSASDVTLVPSVKDSLISNKKMKSQPILEEFGVSQPLCNMFGCDCVPPPKAKCCDGYEFDVLSGNCRQITSPWFLKSEQITIDTFLYCQLQYINLSSTSLADFLVIVSNFQEMDVNHICTLWKCFKLWSFNWGIFNFNKWCMLFVFFITNKQTKLLLQILFSCKFHWWDYLN